ncbi:MAG: transcriptional regulator TetR family [Frankiales bacterium]|jgi:AcrR family transcriptional regulator|nr:transcriptional regulator TetR family [Frankiales bacterium]
MTQVAGLTGSEPVTGALSRRPKRADARRNYDKLIEAARTAFTEHGVDASLEDVARRAGVGIGTLYRNFPSRQELLEATYLEEVQALCESAEQFADAEPWDALVGWLNRFAAYATTKKALSAELLATIGAESDVFRGCHDAIFEAGEPLLARAQQAGVVRPDVGFADAVRLVSGISMVRMQQPEQTEHLLALALDGLRYRPDPVAADANGAAAG